MGLKIYNSLLAYIKAISRNNKEFKLLLKNVIYSKSLYTLDEYFRHNNIQIWVWLYNSYLILILYILNN